MTPRDIEDYNLTYMKLDRKDRARVSQLLEDPRYKDPTWRQYLMDYAHFGKKAELQAFSKPEDIAYAVNEYLPKKLEAMGD
jgi:DNA topoisomerase VI subunit A